MLPPDAGVVQSPADAVVHPADKGVHVRDDRRLRRLAEEAQAAVKGVEGDGGRVGVGAGVEHHVAERDVTQQVGVHVDPIHGVFEGHEGLEALSGPEGGAGRAVDPRPVHREVTQQGQTVVSRGL